MAHTNINMKFVQNVNQGNSYINSGGVITPFSDGITVLFTPGANNTLTQNMVYPYTYDELAITDKFVQILITRDITKAFGCNILVAVRIYYDYL